VRVVLVFGFFVLTTAIVFTTTTALTCRPRRAIAAPSAGTAAATAAPAESMPAAATIEMVALMLSALLCSARSRTSSHEVETAESDPEVGSPTDNP
jgi:hypothetical protein